MSKIFCFLSVLLLFCVGEAAPKTPRGWIVSVSERSGFAAYSANGKIHKFLRRGFLRDWDISPNGRQIAFCAVPQDVDFFSARSVRSYLFLQNSNEKRTRVLIAAYRDYPAPGAVYLDYSSFTNVSFDFSGRLLVINGGEPEDYSFIKGTDLFDWKRRRLQTWKPEIAPTKTPIPLPENMVGRSQTQSVLSRDGATLVYIEETGLQGDGRYFNQDKANFNNELVVTDVKTRARRILLSTRDVLTCPRLSFDERSCVFARLSSDLNARQINAEGQRAPLGQIWRADLKSGELKALTSPQNETDSYPDWSPDGRFITWQRENLGEKNPKKRFKLCVMNADGSAQKPLRFGDGFNGVRWIAALPNWSRFAKFPIEAKVFPTKPK